MKLREDSFLEMLLIIPFENFYIPSTLQNPEHDFVIFYGYKIWYLIFKREGHKLYVSENKMFRKIVRIEKDEAA
jgi:hypothetical protein